MNPDPCRNCGRNRWRTVLKGMAWRCRGCGKLRAVRGGEVQGV